MRILAVDDDVVILDLLKRCLTAEHHYDLTCCASSEEALKLIGSSTTHFDCFLLDIMLPGIDGIELCERVRENKRYHATPILMITASREANLMERAFFAGATDFISKPLEGIELGARINSAAMLNDSLHRERQAQHSLAELTEKSRLRLDEEVDLKGTGVSNILALENALLRIGPGCYAMTLFSIDIAGIRGIYRNVSPAQFRALLESVAVAAVAGAEERNCKMAYAGNGCYVGAMIGRERLKTDAMLARINDALAGSWDSAATGMETPPKLRMGIITDQRLWSGISASDRLREHCDMQDMGQSVPKSKEDELFARFDKRMKSST